MNRQQKISKIGELLSRFVAEVKIFTEANLYDINIHSENVLIPLLNEALGLNLENVNVSQKKNFPAIDLADFTSKVAIQVTSTTTISKINDTFDLFVKNNLDQRFDSLYFFIITEKQNNYSEDSIRKHLPKGFVFDIKKQIIDCSNLFDLIKNIPSITKIDTIERLLLDEFSDVKIDLRRKKYEQRFLNSTPEKIYTNLLTVSFPEQFYMSEISYDKNAATHRINEWILSKGGKPSKKYKPDKLFANVVRHNNIYFKDWIKHENKILTFRNLHSPNEPLRSIIDLGTIEKFNSDEFFNTSADKLNVFKHLLRNSLIQLGFFKEMEWLHERKILRFTKDRKTPKAKQKRWKGINESTKTVIFEVLNKKLGHIVCFRHLAFKPSFDLIDDSWFLTLNPTWSFTNPYTSKTSRFEPYYMSGLKRMESNETIYYFFRFFEYYLIYKDLFSTEYEFLKLKAVPPLLITPSLDDTNWRPVKIDDLSNLNEEGLTEDKELNLTLFD